MELINKEVKRIAWNSVASSLLGTLLGNKGRVFKDADHDSGAKQIYLSVGKPTRKTLYNDFCLNLSSIVPQHTA
ncbi:hypothetical protein L596_024531 [Steinernema carpocapsae]|uniref:Uncharacterized protein n=1 Tax=Steinernema carpocapsae TaxID=34508 RepID=A0A4U5MH19_STECR|nr:hypothetical protein L596_024531 [Steinernema carpocapsae]